jgi:hypothetical protein
VNQLNQVGPQILSSAASSGASGGIGMTFNTQVWGLWNSTYSLITTVGSTASITNATTSVTVWNAWNQFYTGTTYTGSTCTNQCTIVGSNTIIWNSWNDAFEMALAVRPTLNGLERARADRARALQTPQTPEERARYQEQQAKIYLERNAAEERAEKLLRENLSAKQREELSSQGFFTLQTFTDGERRIYRIRRGRSRNVEQVTESGQRIKTLCAHPIEMVPDADTMLAQKLMLEAAETDFLRIANHSA